MKIALILPSLGNLGPVIVANELVNGLRGNSDVSHIHVYYFDEKEKNDTLHFPCTTEKISFFQKLDLSAYSIIHSHGIRPDLFLARQRILNRQLKIVTTVHCYIYPELAQTYNKLIALITTPLWLMSLQPFNKVVFLVNDMKEHYSRYFRRRQLAYVHNYRSVDQVNSYTLSEKETNEVLAFKDGYTLLGTICKLTKRKGVHQLIELLCVEPHYKLIIIGDGKEQANLEALARTKGVSDRVFFTGYKKHAVAFLPLMDVFCLSSNSEGFGLVLLEAALHEKSIVCTDLPSFRELFSEQEVAFFKYGNIQSLQNAIVWAVAESEILGSRARKKTLVTYNQENFIQGYLKVYKDLTNQSA